MECKNCPEGTIRYYDKYEDSKRWDSGLSGDLYTATVWEIKNAGQTGYYVKSDQSANQSIEELCQLMFYNH